MRSIARAARVDPRLVPYYFGSKRALFLEALSAGLERGRPTAETAGVPADVGERVVARFLTLWGERTFVALVGAAGRDRRVLERLRAFVASIVPQVRDDVGGPADLRVGLVASQLLGLGVVRWLLRLEPIASLPVDRVARCVGPGVTFALTGDLATRGDRPAGQAPD